MKKQKKIIMYKTLIYLIFLLNIFCLNIKSEETTKSIEEIQAINIQESAKPIEEKSIIKNKFVKTINGIRDDLELNDIVLLELKNGIVVIQMFPDIARWHVYRIKLLTNEGFYNGLSFFRVIKNFMVQTGDPTNLGTGGSRYGTLQAELDNNLKHKRGTVSMARADNIDSANSQFFIVTGDKNIEHLDKQYTIWGEVIQGIEYVDEIKASNELNNGKVEEPDNIVRMILMQDLNFNYEGDTEEAKENRRQQRIDILRNLKELKKLYNEQMSDTDNKAPLLDRIIELNNEL